MSNSAWCDFKKSDILKLLIKCPNPKCNCQKTFIFTPRQYMLESGSMKSKFEAFFRGAKKAWVKFFERGSKMATPLISSAVALRKKNPQLAHRANNISKSITGGKIQIYQIFMVMDLD